LKELLSSVEKEQPLKAETIANSQFEGAPIFLDTTMSRLNPRIDATISPIITPPLGIAKTTDQAFFPCSIFSLCTSSLSYCNLLASCLPASILSLNITDCISYPMKGKKFLNLDVFVFPSHMFHFFLL
jgi:hypothetical protein